ncbi:MAG: NERD domain-containing protein [Dactylosporangium sp.]|nr:NERD domain-containing protein [Dactylosporangium sp.]NNJ63325.1 NERD domain-containing protein [Dactylosporangium sp.]
MQVIVLSDHGGHQLQQTQRQLRAAGTNLNAWHGAYRTAWADLQSVKHAKPLWKRLLSVSTAEERQAHARVHGAWQEVLRAGAGSEGIKQRAKQQAAGISGEEILTWALSSVLPDEWVMLRGYRNRGGETDHVLVGPQGVWAVEVKRRRVRLHAVADQWWFEKLDARGRSVETGHAVDGGGRTWGRQVAEVTEGLSAWLTRNGHAVPVHTAVMLMHEQAQLGRSHRAGVDLLATHPTDLLQAIADHASPLAPGACEQIVALIRRDHQYHERRRRRPR